MMDDCTPTATCAPEVGVGADDVEGAGEGAAAPVAASSELPPYAPGALFRRPARGWSRGDLLAVSASVVLHLGLIGVAVLGAKAVYRTVAVEANPVVIPGEVTVDASEKGGVARPELADDLTPPKVEAVFGDLPAEATPAAGVTSGILRGLEAGLPESGGEAAAAVAFRPGAGIGWGTGDAAPPPSMTSPGGGGAGLKSPFMGVSGNAMRIAYVCDASGSMMSLFATVRTEVRRAVDALRPIQAFAVIFFSDNVFQTLEPEMLLAAPENRQRVNDFVERASPKGKGSNPVAALKQAFEAGPQLIYFLTDGDFDNNAEIIEAVRVLNAGKTVKLNTIAFGSDPTESGYRFLKQLAEENGGTFTVVKPSDLQR